MRVAMIVDADTMTASDSSVVLPDTSNGVVALAGALADLGHTTRIYMPTEEPAKPRRLKPRVTLQPVPIGTVSPEREPAEFGDALVGEWRHTKPELTHAFGPRAGMAVAAARREQAVPVVQDTRYDAPPADGNGAAWKRLELALGRAADRILVTDNGNASRYAAQGVPRTAIDVVPHAVDLEVFTPEGPASERNGKPRVALLLDQADGEELLAVRPHLPDTELVLLDASCDRAPDEAISVRESDDPRRLAELLRSLDVLVVGANWATAGPVCEESMACGVPVVVVSNGDADDAVLDGVTGAVVPSGRPERLVHAIRQLLRDEARRSAFGIAAADRAASRFTLSRVAMDLDASYGSAVSAGRFSGKAVTGSYARHG